MEDLCRHLALPQFAQFRALYLRVSFAEIGSLVETIASHFPNLQALLLDGGGLISLPGGKRMTRTSLDRYGWWKAPVFDMIESLVALRELQVPLPNANKALLSRIRHLNTLHLVDFPSSDGPLTLCVRMGDLLSSARLPNIRVLTLVYAHYLEYSDLRAILLACPNLERLSLRLAYFKGEMAEVRAKALADRAFRGREEGWLDAIHFDADGADERTGPGVAKLKLFTYDEATNQVKPSAGNLHATYERLIGRKVIDGEECRSLEKAAYARRSLATPGRDWV
jgi:hypothetical protein